MKAMILAAGLGTRLRPLTNDRPKALVEISGHTLLELTIARLKSFGVTEIIVNVHHFADEVAAYLRGRKNFGVCIAVLREDDLLLDTGGGLAKAGWFFLKDSARRDEPFFLHNVDVLTDIDLNAMLKFHCERQALATLAVQSRPTSRPLLFNSEGQLIARAPAIRDSRIDPDRPLPRGRSEESIVRSVATAQYRALAFSGIHVVSTRLLPLLTETGPFSIVDAYLRLSAQGERVIAFSADEYRWRDVGRLSDLSAAALHLEALEEE